MQTATQTCTWLGHDGSIAGSRYRRAACDDDRLRSSATAVGAVLDAGDDDLGLWSRRLCRRVARSTGKRLAVGAVAHCRRAARHTSAHAHALLTNRTGRRLVRSFRVEFGRIQLVCARQSVNRRAQPSIAAQAHSHLRHWHRHRTRALRESSTHSIWFSALCEHRAVRPTHTETDALVVTTRTFLEQPLTAHGEASGSGGAGD